MINHVTCIISHYCSIQKWQLIMKHETGSSFFSEKAFYQVCVVFLVWIWKLSHDHCLQPECDACGLVLGPSNKSIYISVWTSDFDKCCIVSWCLISLNPLESRKNHLSFSNLAVDFGCHFRFFHLCEPPLLRRE